MSTSVQAVTEAYRFVTAKGTNYVVFTDGSAKRIQRPNDLFDRDSEYARIVFVDQRYLAEVWKHDEYPALVAAHPEIPATSRPAVGLAPVMLTEDRVATFNGQKISLPLSEEGNMLFGTAIVSIRDAHPDMVADAAEVSRVTSGFDEPASDLGLVLIEITPFLDPDIDVSAYLR